MPITIQAVELEQITIQTIRLQTVTTNHNSSKWESRTNHNPNIQAPANRSQTLTTTNPMLTTYSNTN